MGKYINRESYNEGYADCQKKVADTLKNRMIRIERALLVLKTDITELDKEEIIKLKTKAIDILEGKEIK